MLLTTEQENPWTAERRDDETRNRDYLRREFINRLRQDEPVCYQLQIQTRPDIGDPSIWHPQQVKQ
jgi:hypothetical protein